MRRLSSHFSPIGYGGAWDGEPIIKMAASDFDLFVIMSTWLASQLPSWHQS